MSNASAMVEPAIIESDERAFQFERLGYFVKDDVDHTSAKPVFNRTVALRDTYKPQRPVTPRRADVYAAAKRIEGRVHRTPVLTSRAVDALLGAELHFKCENLQRMGAFKIRGATNAVRLLPDHVETVATHSSGNHGAALALAAAEAGLRGDHRRAERCAFVEATGDRALRCRRS